MGRTPTLGRESASARRSEKRERSRIGGNSRQQDRNPSPISVGARVEEIEGNGGGPPEDDQAMNDMGNEADLSDAISAHADSRDARAGSIQMSPDPESRNSMTPPGGRNAPDDARPGDDSPDAGGGEGALQESDSQISQRLTLAAGKLEADAAGVGEPTKKKHRGPQ